jgi:lipid-A-disaccharide synthase-like uncharacterized protein
MNFKTFLSQLGIFTLVAAIVLFLIHLVPVFKAHQILGWVGLGMLSSLSVIIYMISERALKSADPNMFSNIFMLSTGFKMLLCAVFILVYDKVQQPADKLYIIPFFLVYFAHLLFEIYFLARMNKSL